MILVGPLTLRLQAEELVQALYARIPSDHRNKGCVIDPLGFAAREDLKRTITFLGIDQVQINFVGCPGGKFEVVMGLRDVPSKVTYALYYPVASQGASDVEKLLAPIVHELAHIRQVQPYGSVAALKDRKCIEKIELTADFITGFIFSNVLKLKDRSLFQASLTLLGTFTPDDPQNHGTPAYRASAFRQGYYIATHNKITDLERAQEIFDRVRFLQIVASEQGIVKRCRQKEQQS
jgi:hypothetical protein